MSDAGPSSSHRSSYTTRQARGVLPFSSQRVGSALTVSRQICHDFDEETQLRSRFSSPGCHQISIKEAKCKFETHLDNSIVHIQIPGKHELFFDDFEVMSMQCYLELLNVSLLWFCCDGSHDLVRSPSYKHGKTGIV